MMVSIPVAPVIDTVLFGYDEWLHRGRGHRKQGCITVEELSFEKVHPDYSENKHDQ